MSDGYSSGGRDDFGSDDGFGRDDLDRLAQRAVDAVTHLARRGMALAGAVLILGVIAGLGGFVLGIAALSGGIETVWIVLGGFFAAMAISLPLTAIWRLRGVRRSADHLVGEVRSLLTESGAKRTVIDTVESAEANQDGGLVVLSQQFFGFRGAIGDRVGDFRAMASALTAVTTFPGLIALATIVSFVFVGLGVIFFVALLL